MAFVTGGTGSKIPGRTSGFIFSIITALCVTIPLVCVPLGVVSVTLSVRALRRLPKGTAGRGLVVAALVIALAAVALTLMLAISAAIRLSDANVI